MKAADAQYGADLVDALNDIDGVYKGLKVKPKYGDMRLEIGAFEQQGDSGGVGHGNMLLPPRVADEILRFVRSKICAELDRIGVEIPKKRKRK